MSKNGTGRVSKDGRTAACVKPIRVRRENSDTLVTLKMAAATRRGAVKELNI